MRIRIQTPTELSDGTIAIRTYQPDDIHLCFKAARESMRRYRVIYRGFIQSTQSKKLEHGLKKQSQNSGNNKVNITLSLPRWQPVAFWVGVAWTRSIGSTKQRTLGIG